MLCKGSNTFCVSTNHLSIITEHYDHHHHHNYNCHHHYVYQEEEEEEDVDEETEEEAIERMKNDIEEIYDTDTNRVAAIQVCTV